jgi:predicted XRE-type DNA-binding protein
MRWIDMARNWKDVRHDTARAGLLDEQLVENARKGMAGEVRAYRLAEIRKQQHVSQKALAVDMRVSQARVSHIERGELARTELGTLQAYVEALGGHLKVVADFGDETLVVRD